MKKVKFENVIDYKEAAQNAMTTDAWHYVDCGADNEFTKRENGLAYDCYRFITHSLQHNYAPSVETTVLGRSVAAPIILAPVSPLTLMHPDGELAQAKAAKSDNIIAAISTDCHYPLEEVAKHGDNLWFQMYCYKDREFLADMISRVEESGYTALVVTIDCTVLGNRERLRRESFKMPDTIKMGNLAGRLGDSQINLVSGSVPRMPLTWDDISWIRSVTKLPVIVKGLLNPQDVLLAKQHGVSGVVLSNHGGRQLDYAMPPIHLLSEARDLVGTDLEIYVDGGITRGTQILKALCLGANAVMIGRPYTWAMTVDGASGIQNIINILCQEMKKSMIQLGVDTLGGLSVNIIRKL